MKNKITYLVLSLLLVIVTTPILAQEECGTELTQVQIDYMNAKREARKNLKSTTDCNEDGFSNTIITIPMVAHIIRDDNGNGGLTTAKLNAAIVNLNEAFEQAYFEFELCEINYIDNTEYTTMQPALEEPSEEYESEEYIMATNNRVAGKVNVFFVANAPASGWASFPSYASAYDKDWVVIKNFYATRSTFAHELGHWLNLYHTHQGTADHLGITAPELVNGTCENNGCGDGIGDELCDTPADPNLINFVDYGCMDYSYRRDANQDLYEPDTRNIMSYSWTNCRTFFSPQQIRRMQISYEDDRSSSLSPCTTSPGCEITAISVSNTTTCKPSDNVVPYDYFTGDVSIYYFGKPTSGGLTLSVPGGSSFGVSYLYVGDNKHTFYNVRMPANGEPVSMTARFTNADNDCSFTDDEVHRGASCILPCDPDDQDCDPCNNMGSLELSGRCHSMGTYTSSDDFFNGRIKLSRPSWPTEGTLDITNTRGDVLLSVPVEQLNNDDTHGHYLPYISLPTNVPLTLTATFSHDNCSVTNTFIKYPCSADCITSHSTASTIGSTIYNNYQYLTVWNSIASSGQLLSGSDVTYDAGRKITLNPGFHAHNGSKFHAFIGTGCDTSAFNGQTQLEYELFDDANVQIHLYNAMGQLVDSSVSAQMQFADTHHIHIGENIPTGVYFCELKIDDASEIIKIVKSK